MFRIGASVRSSHATNAANNTVAERYPVMLNGDTHPRCGASMMVHTRMTMPRSDKIVPTKSNRPT